MNMTISQIKEIFLGDNEISIPFIEERLKILQDVGRILVSKYDGMSSSKKQNNKEKIQFLNIDTHDFTKFLLRTYIFRIGLCICVFSLKSSLLKL